MHFNTAANNFILLITAGITLLIVDLVLFVRKRKTFSESIWTINQKTVALAFIAGLICGHCFTVPGL